MKKTTNHLAMATPCPNRNVKRPMSRGIQLLNPSAKTYLKLILIFWSCAISGSLAQAQTSQTNLPANQSTHILKGKVTDTQNNPLAGATITDTQSQKTAQSDQSGNFALPTNAQKGTVNITYLGYHAQTLAYSTTSPINIQLTEDRSTLQAVEINTGYYSVKQKLLTGAISTVTAKDIEKQPVSNPLSTLQGRITGAYIQQTSATPGGNINITIRGRNGIDASSAPLYLVDGIPFGGPALTSTFSASIGIYTAGGASPLNTLAPEDIQSIDILKDADATAIYGSRGANGVVLITTKKGKRGKMGLEASAQSGLSSPTRHLDMLHTPEYLQLRKLAIALDGTTISPADYDLNGKWSQDADTDWQKQLIGKPAQFSSYRAALSAGSENHSFSLSATHNRQGATYDADLGYSRTAFHLATSLNPQNSKLSATASISYSADRTDWVNNDLTQRSLNLPPNNPALRSADGKLNWEGSTFHNPLSLFEQRYLGANTNLTASSRITYAPIKSLEFSTNLGYSALALEDRNSTPVSYYDPAEGRTPTTSFTDFGNAGQKGWSAEIQGSYTKTLGAGQLSLLLGATLQQTDRKGTYLRGTGFVSDALIHSITAATTTQVRSATQSRYRYGGIYGRVNYTLKERYILNLTARRDGTSRFGPGRKFGNFGAAGMGYVFSEEKWIKNAMPALSTGKLRASYGTSGNDQIGDYEYLDTYQSATGYNLGTGLSPVRLFNPDFSWEQNRKAEIGLDLGFFNDRFTVSLAHYRNLATAQLINYPLSVVTGFAGIRTNLAAKVANSGWEIQLSSRNLARRDFRWTSSFNLTVPRNVLLSFPGLASSSYASQYVIGRSLSSVKLYEITGVDPQTGVYTYTDFNKDGAINAQDRQVIGDRKQHYYGGLDNTFSYKNFELGILFQFVSQTANSFRGQYSISPGTQYNQPQAYQGKYWTKPGDIAELQRPTTGLHAEATQAWFNYTVSNAILADASFIRLKNLSLSYRTNRLIPAVPLRIFAQGQNLATITRYFGLDPEGANSTLPLLRTFTLGLSLTL